MRRVTAVLAAAIVTAALGACSSSGSSGASTSPEETATRTAPTSTAAVAPTDAQLWKRSICNRIDVGKVAETAGPHYRAAASRRTVSSDVGRPAIDYCAVTLKNSAGTDPATMYFGVSAATWSATQWDTYVRARVNGDYATQDARYGERQRVDGQDMLVERGPGATRVLLHVGDRILAVADGTVGLTSRQLGAELDLALPLADTADAWPAEIVQPGCTIADTAAAAALGAVPTIRRDQDIEGEQTCRWATRDEYVTVEGDDGPANWPVVVRAMQRRWPNAQRVDGVGAAAVFTGRSNGEPATLRIASEHHLVLVRGFGGHVGKATLTAVGKAIVGHY